MPFGLGTIAMIGGGAIAAAGFIPIVIGFGTEGVVAGSVAAATQSSIGAVAAGSMFATMTSLWMTGVFSTLAGVGSAITGVGAAIAALLWTIIYNFKYSFNL